MPINIKKLIFSMIRSLLGCMSEIIQPISPGHSGATGAKSLRQTPFQIVFGYLLANSSGPVVPRAYAPQRLQNVSGYLSHHF